MERRLIGLTLLAYLGNKLVTDVTRPPLFSLKLIASSRGLEVQPLEEAEPLRQDLINTAKSG